MQKYLDINLFIAPGADGTISVNAVSRNGDGSGNFTLPFRLDDITAALFQGQQDARRIGNAEAPAAAPGSGPSPESYGIALFDALFQKSIRDVLVSNQTAARGAIDPTGVRIRLAIAIDKDGMGDIASVPWELMRSPGDISPLVVTNTALVRTLASNRPTEPRPIRDTLNILVITSNPPGTDPLDIGRELSQLQTVWAGLANVRIEIIDKPSKARLLDKLSEADFHIVHYMGHGGFDPANGGKLMLQDDAGQPALVGATDFAVWLQNEPLHLVFLNACNTGTTGTDSLLHPYAGVATALVRAGVPAVLAMQFPISDAKAIVFARTFYDRISKGYPIDAAVADGRMMIYEAEPTVGVFATEWATPVLYLRAADGDLLADALRIVPAGTAMASITADAPVTIVTAVAWSDPWASAADGDFCIFLATPDPPLESQRQQLGRLLRALPGVRVVDEVPAGDRAAHAAAVTSLARRADLCVHLLGATPGVAIDADAPLGKLDTFPMEQLRIGITEARAQLVIMTNEARDSIDSRAYETRIDELVALPRVDKNKFEFQIIDKLAINDAVLAKQAELARLRAPAPGAATGGDRRKAFVDAHGKDVVFANDLADFLDTRNIDTNMSAGSQANPDMAVINQVIGSSFLYVIVQGGVDKDWARNRKMVIRRAANTANPPAKLLITLYTPAAADSSKVSFDRFTDFNIVGDIDTTALGALFGDQK